ncbi:hypothetical protein EDC01DRAFT_630708 [Geopyxis carbonaria]|nr:hypothetical protein EDC01DRAFT_630708 [Geopyxis carbonaria]
MDSNVGPNAAHKQRIPNAYPTTCSSTIPSDECLLIRNSLQSQSTEQTSRKRTFDEYLRSQGEVNSEAQENERISNLSTINIEIANARARQVRLSKRNAKAAQNLHRVENQIYAKTVELSQLEKMRIRITNKVLSEHAATVKAIRAEQAELVEQTDIQREYRRRIHRMNQGVLGAHWMDRRFVETGLLRIESTEESQRVMGIELTARLQAVVEREARLVAREKALNTLPSSYDSVGKLYDDSEKPSVDQGTAN